MQFRVLSVVATAAAVVSATDYATTTTTAVSSYPTGDACFAACTATFSNCKAQPNENNAFCVSEYAGCLGYNPFTPGAPSPTACSTTSTPTPTPSSPTYDTCFTACTATFENCKAQPNENNAYCVSEYAGCLGYNPYTSGAPSPTACSLTSTPSPTPTPPTYDTCFSACTATFDNCKAQPNENNAYCVSEYATCLGYNPFTSGAPSPTACSLQSTTTANPYTTVSASIITTAKPTTTALSVGTVGPTPTTTSTVPFTGAGNANKPVYGALALGLLAML